MGSELAQQAFSSILSNQNEHLENQMSDLSQNMNHNFSLTHQNMNHNFGVTHQNQFQLLKGTLQGLSHVGEIVACNGVKLDWIQSSVNKNEMLIHQANRDRSEMLEMERLRQAETQNFQKMQLKCEMELRSAETEARREERREDRQIREDRREREEKLRAEEQAKAEKRATDDRERKERELKQQLLREDAIRREKHDEEMKRIARDAKFKRAERESQREIDILRLNQDESQFMIKALLAVFMALIFASIFVMKRSQN